MADDYASPIWAVVANVVRERRAGELGSLLRIGTRKFTGGAKVYIVGAYWGMGGERVTVIGRYRGKNFISCTIDAMYLENFRVKLAYHPEVIRRLAEYGHGIDKLDGSLQSKLKADSYAEIFAQNSDYWIQQRLAKWAIRKLELRGNGSS
jgi:hypothetical protein